MIVFSDLHLDEDSADTVLGEILPGIFEASQRLDDRTIACLGDFWHLRYKVDVALQNAVRDELIRWIKAGVTFLFLPGNHDQVDVAGRNALEVFDGLGQGCQVFTRPTWNQYGLWLPYRKHYRDIEDILRINPDVDMPRPGLSHANVLWMHQGIQGALMNDHMRDTEGVPASVFDPFDAVILGHYHKRQRLGKAYYVGSPRQVTANESGQEKGFAVWDGKKLRYVTTRWGKRFHRIRLEPGQSLDMSGILPTDDVRVSTAVGIDPSVVGSQLAALGVQHAVTPDLPSTEQRLEVEVNSTLVDYARAYVNQLPTGLNRDRLMTVFEELTA